MQSKVNESIQHNDLKDLINPVISIDQYKSKIGADTNIIVVGIKVKGDDPSKDLSQFLETGNADALDVDIGPGPDEDSFYTVFVEFERNSKIFDNIDRVVNDLMQVDDTNTQYTFTSYKNDMPIDWSKENCEEHIISSSYDYGMKYPQSLKESKRADTKIRERIDFLINY
mgnify:FL=1|tara:strand:+ start:7382 stop:7891 length:510 start_codon:yes stop_codon:yes gene_type:complete